MEDHHCIDMFNELQTPENHQELRGLDLGRPSRKMDHQNAQVHRRKIVSRSSVVSSRTPRMPIIAPPSPPPRVIDQSKLRFLFEKQLQNSDVNAAGRIVIPKRLAELYLPSLESKEGTWLHVDDMDYLRVWTLKFRYWPNNSSRMYVLENTKDLVSIHGLTVDDYIMIFKDDENGSYVLRAKTSIGSAVQIPGAYINSLQEANNMAINLGVTNECRNWQLSNNINIDNGVEGFNNTSNNSYMYNGLANPTEFLGNSGYTTTPQSATNSGQVVDAQIPVSDPFFDFSFFG